MSKTDKFSNNKINKNIYLWNEMIHVVMLIGIFVEILKKALFKFDHCLVYAVQDCMLMSWLRF